VQKADLKILSRKFFDLKLGAVSLLAMLFAPAINQAERTDLDCDEFFKKSILKDRVYLTYQGA